MQIKLVAIPVVVVIIIAVALVMITEHTNSPSSGTINLLPEENTLHVFSSNTLSFNFTSGFYLENSTGLLISDNFNHARLYYMSNKSVVITILQNTSNMTFGAMKALLMNEYSPPNYTYENITVDGFDGIEAYYNKPTFAYRLALVYGPAGYYTLLLMEEPNQLLLNVSNSAFDLVLSSMKFSPSVYIPTS